MITVLLPVMLRAHADGAETLTVTAPANSIAELLASLARTAPRLMRQLDLSLYGFVVNGEMVPRDVAQYPLAPGDRVEVERRISDRRDAAV